MQNVSAVELGAQMVLELPDRELLGGLIHISGNDIDIAVLTALLNGSFNNWTISVLSFNKVDVNVSDNLSQNDLDAFCNQVVAVLSAQCSGQVLN